MNTIEIKIKGKIKTFKDIFFYAKKQFLAYEKIEGINNLDDFSIDCAVDQIKFKDMLQIRFVEELCEATEAIDCKQHFYEEVTDAMNFLLSTYIMAGIDLNTLPDPNKLIISEGNIPTTESECALLFFPLIFRCGMICNLLKNRPWAQSNYLVSLLDFNNEIQKLWIQFWEMMGQIGLKEEQLAQLFEQKYEVNKWRIKTGY